MPLTDGGYNSDPDLNDRATVRSVVNELNTTIAYAVASVNEDDLIYVDTNGSGSPYVGHDWCSSESFFQIIALNQIEYSFHPNSEGHQPFATILKEAMN